MSHAKTNDDLVDVTVTVSDRWQPALRRVAERMGCPEDFAEAFGRALSLAEVVTHHLAEQDATIVMISPSRGEAQLIPDPLYGATGVPLAT